MHQKVHQKISVIKTNSFDWELLTFDDIKKIVHFGILIHFLSWKQKRLLWLLGFSDKLFDVLFDTNIWHRTKLQLMGQYERQNKIAFSWVHSTVVNLNSDGMKWLSTSIYTLLSNILVSALKNVSNWDNSYFRQFLEHSTKCKLGRNYTKLFKILLTLSTILNERLEPNCK